MESSPSIESSPSMESSLSIESSPSMESSLSIESSPSMESSPSIESSPSMESSLSREFWMVQLFLWKKLSDLKELSPLELLLGLTTSLLLDLTTISFGLPEDTAEEDELVRDETVDEGSASDVEGGGLPQQPNMSTEQHNMSTTQQIPPEE